MTAIFTIQSAFLSLLGIFLAGAAGSLILRKNDSWANGWSSFCAVTGSLVGAIFGIATMISGNNLSFGMASPLFPLLSISFYVDTLSAFFIAVISIIALFCSLYGFGYVKHFYKKYSIGALGFFYHLFIAGMILVVSASNGLFFLIVWEIMSVASYFLVVYDRNDENNVKAGFLYLIMTHIGTAFITFAFFLLYKFTGSFDFEAIKAGSGALPVAIKNAVFVLAMIGFGTKAGIVPFHIWLPSAHPAAPSHVSGLMSGVMIKTGVYMMIRLFMDMLQPIPTWWGLTVLVIGAVSSLLGVLYALSEHDIKKLLAYHSIENIGIILLGLGSALTFSSIGMPVIATIALAASLFHTLNHATFKSLLFLSAGSVINKTHTRNMEEYGGLIKFMPLTALFFLVGSMAISALPPFNGFFSEWLTFQSLFQGIASADVIVKWFFVLGAGSLAFTGGLALACFVKVFGITFLARPRSDEVFHAKESSFSLIAGMGALAVLSLIFGVFSGYLITFLEKAATGMGFLKNATTITSAASGHGALSVGNGFASVSAPALFVFLLVALVVSVIVFRFVINRHQKVKVGMTWDCGTNLRPRMEITATGFARSIILIFKGVLKPSIQQEITYDDAKSRYLPKSHVIIMGIHDVYYSYLYQPIIKVVTVLSSWATKIQNGNINVYVLYVLIALILALISAL
jgi:hydrogenase-4 component B